MASRVPVRSLNALCRTQRKCCHCASMKISFRAPRHFSTTPLRSEEQAERPRWSYTPPQMKAPFHPREKDPSKAWTCNEDPAKVNAMYSSLLGKGGDKILSDEVKWLAITHKSFDQGRRGFNDRLALFGKRILILQTTLALLNTPSKVGKPMVDIYGRMPSTEPALASLPNVSPQAVNALLSKEKTSQIAQSYGIDAVTRWKPRNPANLSNSGCEVVFTTSLFAIIGAIALQKGGEIANEIVRTRILSQLDL